MSQARTAYVMLLFAVILFDFILFIKRKSIGNNAFRICLITGLCVIIGFGTYYTVLNNIITNKIISDGYHTVQNNVVANKIVSKAIDDNLLSVASEINAVILQDMVL